MAFYPYNPLVQMYAGEEPFRIEKSPQELEQDPATLQGLYNNLVNAYNKLMGEYTLLNTQNNISLSNIQQLSSTLSQERQERATEQSAYQTSLITKNSDLADANKVIADWYNWQEDVYNTLGKPNSITTLHDIQKHLFRHDDKYEIEVKGEHFVVELTADEQKVIKVGGTSQDTPIIVKDVADAGHDIIANVNGTILAFPKHPVPQYWTLKEMYDFCDFWKNVKGTVQQVYDALNTTTATTVSLSDINQLLTFALSSSFDKTRNSLKDLRDDRDFLKSFQLTICQHLLAKGMFSNTAPTDILLTTQLITSIKVDISRLFDIERKYNNLKHVISNLDINSNQLIPQLNVLKSNLFS